MDFRNGQETTTCKYIFLLSQLSACLFSKYLLFYYWKSLLCFDMHFEHQHIQNTEAAFPRHTTIATVSSPLSKNFYISPFFPCYYRCGILPTHHCISVMRSQGQFVYLFFRSFFRFQKTTSPLTRQLILASFKSQLKRLRIFNRNCTTLIAEHQPVLWVQKPQKFIIFLKLLTTDFFLAFACIWSNHTNSLRQWL